MSCPAIVVVIKKRAARAKRLGKKFSTVGSAVVLKLDSRRGSDVGETKTEARGWSGEEIVQRKGRVEGQGAGGHNKFTTLHGRVTKPLRNSVDNQFGGFVNAECIHDVGTVHRDGVGTEIQINGQFPCWIFRRRYVEEFRVLAW